MRKYLVLTIAVLLALGGALAAGCGGGESPVGEYKWKSGEEAVADMTIMLADDGTFTLSGVAAGADLQQIIEGTWTQDGSQVTLTLGEGDEADSEAGEYKDGQLIFDDVVWEKQ